MLYQTIYYIDNETNSVTQYKF